MSPPTAPKFPLDSRPADPLSPSLNHITDEDMLRFIYKTFQSTYDKKGAEVDSGDYWLTLLQDDDDIYQLRNDSEVEPNKFLDAVSQCDLYFLRKRRNSIANKSRRHLELSDADTSDGEDETLLSREEIMKYRCELDSDDLYTSDSDLQEEIFDVLRDLPTWQELKISVYDRRQRWRARQKAKEAAKQAQEEEERKLKEARQKKEEEARMKQLEARLAEQKKLDELRAATMHGDDEKENSVSQPIVIKRPGDLSDLTWSESESDSIEIQGPPIPDKKLMSPELKAMCGNLLNEIFNSPRSFYFCQPFPYEKWNITDFAEYVPDPIHLGIVKERLENDYYETPADFAADVRMIFEGAALYHWRGNERYKISQKATVLLEDFDESYHIILEEDEMSKQMRLKFLAEMKPTVEPPKKRVSKAKDNPVAGGYLQPAVDDRKSGDETTDDDETEDSADHSGSDADEEGDSDELSTDLDSDQEHEVLAEEMKAMQDHLQGLVTSVDATVVEKTKEEIEEIRIDMFVAQEVTASASRMQRRRTEKFVRTGPSHQLFVPQRFARQLAPGIRRLHTHDAGVGFPETNDLPPAGGRPGAPNLKYRHSVGCIDLNDLRILSTEATPIGGLTPTPGKKKGPLRATLDSPVSSRRLQNNLTALSHKKMHERVLKRYATLYNFSKPQSKHHKHSPSEEKQIIFDDLKRSRDDFKPRAGVAFRTPRHSELIAIADNPSRKGGGLLSKLQNVMEEEDEDSEQEEPPAVGAYPRTRTLSDIKSDHKLMSARSTRSASHGPNSTAKQNLSLLAPFSDPTVVIQEDMEMVDDDEFGCAISDDEMHTSSSASPQFSTSVNLTPGGVFKNGSPSVTPKPPPIAIRPSLTDSSHISEAVASPTKDVIRSTNIPSIIEEARYSTDEESLLNTLRSPVIARDKYTEGPVKELKVQSVAHSSSSAVPASYRLFDSSAGNADPSDSATHRPILESISNDDDVSQARKKRSSPTQPPKIIPSPIGSTPRKRTRSGSSSSTDNPPIPSPVKNGSAVTAAAVMSNTPASAVSNTPAATYGTPITTSFGTPVASIGTPTVGSSSANTTLGAGEAVINSDHFRYDTAEEALQLYTNPHVLQTLEYVKGQFVRVFGRVRVPKQAFEQQLRMLMTDPRDPNREIFINVNMVCNSSSGLIYPSDLIPHDKLSALPSLLYSLNTGLAQATTNFNNDPNWQPNMQMMFMCNKQFLYQLLALHGVFDPYSAQWEEDDDDDDEDDDDQNDPDEDENDEKKEEDREGSPTPSNSGSTCSRCYSSCRSRSRSRSRSGSKSRSRSPSRSNQNRESQQQQQQQQQQQSVELNNSPFGYHWCDDDYEPRVLALRPFSSSELIDPGLTEPSPLSVEYRESDDNFPSITPPPPSRLYSPPLTPIIPSSKPSLKELPPVQQMMQDQNQAGPPPQGGNQPAGGGGAAPNQQQQPNQDNNDIIELNNNALGGNNNGGGGGNNNNNNGGRDDIRNSSFTLQQIVLILVVIIVGILVATVVLPSGSPYDEESKQKLFQEAQLLLNEMDDKLRDLEMTSDFKVFQEPAPLDHPTQLWVSSLSIGSFIDALDVQQRWYTAQVVDVDPLLDRLLVHYDDWPTQWNEWVLRQSGKLAPLNTHAIGGRREGGLAGYPLLPTRKDIQTAVASQHTTFETMRIEYESSGDMLPDVLLQMDLPQHSEHSNRNIMHLAQSETIWEAYFYETGKTLNDRAIYQHNGRYLYFQSDQWVLASDLHDSESIIAYTQSTALRPDLTSTENWFWTSRFAHRESDIPISKVQAVAASKSRGEVEKRIPNPFDYNALIELNNKVQLPMVTLGTAGLPYSSSKDVIHSAIRLGYTSIDTAAMGQSNSVYFNQHWLREILDESPRFRLFLTTKIPAQAHGYHSTIHNFMTQLRTMDTGYMDLVLIHNPGCPDGHTCQGTWIDTYHALEHLYKKGRIRAIGVSNFNVSQLEQLWALKSKHIPLSVVRNWRDPLHNDIETVVWCQSRAIHYQSYSAMGGQRLLSEALQSNPLLHNPVIREIAHNNGLTAAEVITKWNLENGVSVVIGSTNAQHLKQNLNAYSNRKLSNKDIHAINRLESETQSLNDDSDT